MFLELPASFYIAGAHAIFCMACLAIKERRGSHDIIGALWIAVTAAAIMRRSVLLLGPMDAWYIRMLGYPAAYGPLAYLYASTLSEARPLKWQDAVHMLPFVFLSLLTAVAGDVFAVHTMESSGPEVRVPFLLLDIFSLLSMGAYSVATLRMIQKHRLRLRQYFSNITPARSLLWLNAFNWIFVAYLIPPTLIHSGLVEAAAPPHRVTTAIFIGYLMLVSLFLVRQGPIFKPAAPGPVSGEEDAGEKKETRYERSMISQERMTQIETDLLTLMDSEKPHLDEDLDLPALASLLRITPHQLSQTLNLKVKKSFHTFVNEYRVREAEARLTDPAYAEYSILRIALEAGFNSKSSFHARFRKVKGISPGEFRAKAAKPGR